MRILPAILANIFLVISATGFGTLLRRLLPQSFSRIDRIAMTLLGGFGILGTALFLIGQIWFSRPAILLVLTVGALLAIKQPVKAVGSLPKALVALTLPILPVAIVVLVLFVTAAGGLALPTDDMNNDSIAYHYYGPKVWLREGVIRGVPDEVLTYFPVTIETQYGALMSMGGQRAPGLFAVFGLSSLLLITGALAIRLGLNPSGAWWTAALIAAMPALYRGAYGGFIDVLFAGFVLAAARIAFDAERPAHYALFGVFCGIAMGTKYTGIIACTLLICCSLFISVVAYHRPFPAILKCLGISCAAAIAMASPFYLRNWILYGCPIYPPPPPLLRFFAAKNMSPAVMHELLKNVRETGQGMGGSFLDFLLLPFNLTYHTANFRGAGGIGLAPWALGPFGLLARRRDAFAMGLLLFSILELSSWFLTAQVSRYLIPVYVIGAIFGVLGWQYADRWTSSYGRVLSAAVVAISICYGLVMIVPDRQNEVHAALSSSFEQKWWRQATPYAESFDYLNGDPAVKKVLILDEGTAAYFLDKEFVKPFGRWGEQTIPGAANTAEVMSRLQGLQVTHILDVRPEKGSFKLPGHPAGLTLVFERENQRIYRVE